MKYTYFVLSILFFGVATLTNAQQSSVLVQPTIGITSPILDNGIGVHIGVNPNIRLTNRLSAEGQISYIYFNITSSFLSGRMSAVHSINALVGGRGYLNAEERRARWFVNLLCGMNYSKEKSDPLPERSEYTLGFSVGTFLELDKIIVGWSYDTPQNIVLKVGYSF